MARAKKIFAVYYSCQYGLAMQPVKADSKEDAGAKFVKRNPKLEDAMHRDDIIEITPDHQRYRTFKQQAI